MKETRERPSRLRRALLLWAAWNLVGLAFGLQIHIVERGVYGARIEWWRPFAINLLCYQIWFLLTPLVLYLGRRFPLETAGWRRSLAVHASASVLIPSVYLVLCQVLVFHPLRSAAYRPKTLLGEYLLSVFANLHLEVITYWAIVAIQHAVRISRERSEREVNEARILAQLAEARLAALMMQLQPHFLFNTLNAVSALVHEDPEAAERMLARLGELLRLTLESAGRREVALREELELLSCYFAIEEVRFADRLTVRVEAEPATLDALVPNLLLQPIAENAIRHGIARREGPGEVVVTARAGRGMLAITVKNDGPPLAGADRRDGIGLSNTRARLAQLYGDAARLVLSDAPGGGVRAELTLPLRVLPPPAEATE